eukprot:TRINITY_DN20413_c0_g1_i1.p1 TRINITY_DN20413_c0_g1~~TRINITY_DN20413_c0_g1_i1.p1  ORF type:complete len:249 (-),score=48.88 TRINITY_DN20413_c0_g1_i1:365-1111(-)
MADLNSLYKREKGQNANMNAPDKEKWEAVLSSNDERLVQNGMFVGQQLLQKNQGFEIFKDLLYSNDDKIAQNTMHLLINVAASKMIVDTIKARGATRILQVVQNAPPAKQVILLQFCGNFLTDATVHDTFIQSGGMAFSINLLSTGNVQQSTLGLRMITNIFALKQKVHDYNAFSSAEHFTVFCEMLQNSAKYEEDAIKLVLSILANLVNTENNRKLFYECKGIPACIHILQTIKKPEFEMIIVTLFF